MKTIDELIEKCGGEALVAHHTGAHQVTVRGWSTLGIPEKYWGVIMKLQKGRITANDIYALNRVTRAKTVNQ